MSREEDMDDMDDLAKKIQESILEDAKEIYTERTIEEAYNPKNVGEIKDADGIGRITGPCGDTMQIHLKIEDGKIADSQFLTDGCGSSIACGSVITELAKGKTVKEASEIEDKDILSILGGLPEESLHCPILAMNTLRAAIEDYKVRDKY
jgi:nitrogen fixation NifU-like protein